MFNDHNYLTFEFNTSIETYNELKNKKLILELEVAGEDGLTHVPSPDSAAVYGEEPNQYYIIGGVQKDGLINVRIGTHSYFDASTNSKKGKYKLTSLYRADDGKKTNLLNESSSEVKITW
ncbi:hypothetical protein JM47_00860 [Ureaplasma diversum]|uniref:Uncharacterized protein n=1 Tax=Ureaplasma diversum TaxID=42094 RepID=A0A0C5RKK8_9BACT|nr:hypothetical protein [Ureaplasma diversum]AJQ45193.1 hypothetical protein JM47_00860 [Ureaplasma diversum]